MTDIDAKVGDIGSNDSCDKKKDSYEEMEFDSLNDFKEYYRKNKERLDKMTTVMINKLYNIHGYVIRKNYGEIGFKTIKSTVKVSKTEKRLAAIEKAVNQVINVLNQIQDRLEL